MAQIFSLILLEKILLALYFMYRYFNVGKVTLITGHLQKTGHRKLSTTWIFLRPQDLSLTEISNLVFSSLGWETRFILTCNL